jgi:hypothetical protein
MLIVIVVSALVGSVATSVVLWPLGMLIALAAAPLGSTLLVLVVVAAVKACEAKPRLGRSYRRSQNQPIIQ